jgi:hypothetical protein
MSIARGIAVLGIWGAVAVIGWHDPTSGVVAALFAMFATEVVCKATNGGARRSADR